MPGLDTNIHLDMLRGWKRRQTLVARIYRAIRNELNSGGRIYGFQWGDPDVMVPLKHIRDHWVLPYVNPQQTAVEIGPGGGRWTRYLVGFKKLYVVDYYQELLDELKINFRRYPNITFLKNTGSDFPGIAPHSIDFVFSFGTFVHLDFNIIEIYLDSIREILRPGGNAIIQYSDMAKPIAQTNPGFSDNTVERMRAAVTNRGFRILQEDTGTMWHSSLVRFTV